MMLPPQNMVVLLSRRKMNLKERNLQLRSVMIRMSPNKNVLVSNALLPNAPNIIIKGGVCMQHGAKKPICRYQEGCTNNTTNGEVCVGHGAKPPAAKK